MKPPRLRWERAALLALTIAAFAHVALGLGSKTLWWDESLSLQRAESDLVSLVRGLLIVQDGTTVVPTIDQHPFFSFLLQGILIRLAGNSEYTLRFVSAAAATLLAPALYTFARLFARRGVIPWRTPLWTAALAAGSPFLLWYGQEARPYALWALLAVLATYLLLAGLENRPRRAAWWLGYAATLGLFLSTHYYAVFLLPVHALIVYAGLARNRRRLALGIAAGLLAVGAAIAAFAVWMVIRQGGGGNFPRVTLAIILPDLVNAFTHGLSVNIERVQWLNVIALALAVLGTIWMVRSRATLGAGGWIVVAMFVTPVVVLLAGNQVSGLYMNARHMSLIAGPWLLLVATGISVIGRQVRWADVILALLLFGGFAYSTYNYYAVEAYQKDDYRSLGAYMGWRVMPGDVVLYYPPSSWRIFEYYVPMQRVHAAEAAGAPVAVYGVPRLDAAEETGAWLGDLAQRYRRIWVLKSGTHPYLDVEGKVEEWLRTNLVRVRDMPFFSTSSLRAQLYIPRAPVEETLAPAMPAPAGVTFADNITLAGTGADWSAWDVGVDDLPLPVTLYWQVQQKPERRAKYILELVESGAEGERVLGRVEREPWEGDIPTTFWDPGKTILEWVELRHEPPSGEPGAELFFRIQLYDAETLEKLPVTDANGFPVAEDGFTVQIPFPER